MASEPDLEDLSAIHRVLAGDRDAFRILALKYGDRLLRFLRSRLDSEEEAADLAQEVLLRAYRSLGRFRLGESFASWLFAIAANRSRTGARRAAAERKRVAAAGAAAAVSAEADPAAGAERSLEAEALKKAVSLLPAALRETIELYYYGGLSVAEAARSLGLGEEAVKSRLFRARVRLRECLEGPKPKGRGGGIL